MTRNLALTNTILQVLLMVTVLVAFWLARRRRFKRHCWLVRVALAVQIVLIAALMAPSLNLYLGHWTGWSWFIVEMIVHHVLGVVVVLFFVYANLAVQGVVRSPRRLRPYMRSALVVWLAALGLGLYLYVRIWG